jgi:hypothetical protein
MNHKSRYNAWSRFCNNELAPEQLSDAWLQPEQKSLADLYAPCESKNTQSDLSALDPEIRQRCKDLGVLSLPSAQMEEEQEREVNREREREREQELPPRAEPAEHFFTRTLWPSSRLVSSLHCTPAAPFFLSSQRSKRVLQLLARQTSGVHLSWRRWTSAGRSSLSPLEGPWINISDLFSGFSRGVKGTATKYSFC